MFNIVLYEPEIPYNTGNIGRTCVASGNSLHLIKPLGFVLSDKYIKRAGLDYWPYVKLEVHESLVIISCSGRRVAEYLRKYWLTTRRTV